MSDLAVYCCSSNGKSVTWSQNERAYRPNLWKRMSFHIKKKEAVEANQTAIIKPFSKDGIAPVDASVSEQYEEPVAAQPFICSESRAPLSTISQNAAKSRGSQGEMGREEEPAPPSYVPQPPGSVRRRSGNGQDALTGDDGDVSMVGVGDIGIGVIGGQPQGTTIMDQISSVVNRFTANISELNTMMLPGGAASPASTSPTDTPVCPSHLPPRDRQAPSTVTTYAEVAAVTNFCDNRAAGKIYEHVAGTCVSSRRPKDLEELFALTPPSPFRDSSLSSECSSPTSMSPTSEAEYDQLLLKHFSQSSSSL